MRVGAPANPRFSSRAWHRVRRVALVSAAIAAAAVGLRFALSPTHVALAADHNDGPMTSSDPSADITDTYVFKDGLQVALIMNVAPAAPLDAKFSDKVQYVFHTTSSSTLVDAGVEKDIIATFDADQKIQLWVGADDYVTGDASITGGLLSKSGKLKVFAGVRDDPSFFNLEGFTDMTSLVAKDVGNGMVTSFDAAGCPAFKPAAATSVIDRLQKTQQGGMPAADAFAGKNVLSLVVSVDATLLTAGGKLLSVWTSTNKGS